MEYGHGRWQENISSTFDISRHNITRNCTQYNNFEGKTSTWLSHNGRAMAVSFVSYWGKSNREISGVYYIGVFVLVFHWSISPLFLKITSRAAGGILQWYPVQVVEQPKDEDKCISQIYWTTAKKSKPNRNIWYLSCLVIFSCGRKFAVHGLVGLLAISRAVSTASNSYEQFIIARFFIALFGGANVILALPYGKLCWIDIQCAVYLMEYAHGYDVLWFYHNQF